MDTLWLAGEMEEFARCLRWVTSDMDLDVDQVCALVFEYGCDDPSASPAPASDMVCVCSGVSPFRSYVYLRPAISVRRQAQTL